MPEAPLGPHPHGTARWQSIREQQLRREPLCRYCADLGRDTAATVADHVVPHRGDPDRFWHGELQSLCASCHSAVKQAEERGSGRRGAGRDGLPLDPGHPWA